MLNRTIKICPDKEHVTLTEFVPESRNKKSDAVLVIPGGAYLEVCADREGEPIAIDFLAKGYNAFVLNYRTGWGTAPFAQLIDAARAMIYLRENATHLKIDPKRVFAVGFSAGGHLCYALATMYEYPEVKAVFGERYKLARPTGAILSYPVTVIGDKTHQNSFKNLLGRSEFVFTEDEINKFSLERVVDSGTAPMFLWHTYQDNAVPVQGTMKLALALADRGIPAKVSIYPYGCHGIALGTELSSNGNSAFVQPLASSWTSEADGWMKTLPDYEY